MKNTHIVLSLLAAFGLVLGVIVLSLKVDEITVSGNSHYTDEELIERIFATPADRNTVCCYIKDQLKEHQQIPFVEDYSLVFHSNSQVEVIVHEKSVVGYVSYMSSCMYFDKDGIIVESTNETIDGIPRIVGLEFGQIVLHQPIPVADEDIFKDILNLTQILSMHEMNVDRIQFDRRRDTTLYMGDLEVFLGSSSDMDGKILKLSNMLPKLEGLRGTLYLDTYDPANTSMAYIFKRKS